MADLKKLLLGNGITQFSETFTLSFTPGANSTWYNNAFNNWNYVSYCSAAVSGVGINGSKFYGDTVGTGGNNFCGKVCRSREGYNINRNYDLKYSFVIYQPATPYSTVHVSMSIGGNDSSLSLLETLYGLEFRAYAGVSGQVSFSVYNNGVGLGTMYSGSLSRGTEYYVFVRKRGTSVGITINTTNIEPATPAFTYTMNDTTALSNSLIGYISGQGHSDYGGQASIDNIRVTLY